MTEETVTTTAQPQVEQTQNNLADQAASVLDSLGSFLPADKLAQIQSLAGSNTQPVVTEGDKPTEEKNDPANTDETKPEGDKPVEAKPEGEKPVEEKKSILGLNKKKPAGASEIVIENPEQILEVVKTKFGQEFKEIKELPKFFESAQKWRADAQKMEEATTKLEQFERGYDSLPQEIRDAVDLFAKGEDHTQAFAKKANFDLNKPFEKQDLKTLVNSYFPGKFTDEDFTEEQKSEILLMAQEAAETKFKAEKQMHDSKRAAVSENAAKQLAAEQKAVSSSVSNLKQRFPEMDESILKDVTSTIEGGVQNVLSFFYNSDGTVKPDAAVNLLMAKHNASIMDELMGISTHVAETKVNEELLSRGADTPKPTRTSGAPEKIDEETQKRIDEITRVGKATSARTF